MSNLKAFLAQNKIKKENVKYVASTSFIDENGKPIEWEIRAITSQENDDIKQQCTKRVRVAGKSGAFTMEIDPMLYVGKLAAACTVFPDLKDATLQDSYKVMGDDALLKAMLSAGEYTNYTNKVSEINGFDESINDVVEEAKKLIEGGDSESNYAYYCLHKLRWKPSDFVNMDKYEKAFVIAAIDIKAKQDKKEMKKGRRKR